MPFYPFSGYPAVYVDPTIVSFVADPPIAEMGSTVASVVLGWELSKTALTLSVAGQSLAPNAHQKTIVGPFTTNQSWPLAFADAQQTVKGKATLRFLNKAYWGFVTSAPASSADILALENSVFSTSAKSPTIFIGQPDAKTFAYAYPKRFGPPKVQITFSSGLWNLPDTTEAYTDFTNDIVAFTNASGFTEDYYVVTFASLQHETTVIRFNWPVVKIDSDNDLDNDSIPPAWFGPD